MKVKNEPFKVHPVPPLRVVVNNRKVKEKPLKENMEDKKSKNISENEITSAGKKKGKNRDIPEFYQHTIKPRKYDFF